MPDNHRRARLSCLGERANRPLLHTVDGRNGPQISRLPPSENDDGSVAVQTGPRTVSTGELLWRFARHARRPCGWFHTERCVRNQHVVPIAGCHPQVGHFSDTGEKQRSLPHQQETRDSARRVFLPAAATAVPVCVLRVAIAGPQVLDLANGFLRLCFRGGLHGNSL